ncbi:hypothetical protein MAM1_0554c10902 [Mucor ambiguus]|uniref:Uncharacterized protein n=1 Tax=Mucor ambiguus TaxID=91626 RepID=A0A0C9N9E1_9FUNG|nr:hypothetical protein MAM1_0554c10902 [Mucor ambiguus]
MNRSHSDVAWMNVQTEAPGRLHVFLGTGRYPSFHSSQSVTEAAKLALYSASKPCLYKANSWLFAAKNSGMEEGSYVLQYAHRASETEHIRLAIE